MSGETCIHDKPIENFLENSVVATILQDSYLPYKIDFRKEVRDRYKGEKDFMKVVNEVCAELNKQIQDFYNDIS